MVTAICDQAKEDNTYHIFKNYYVVKIVCGTADTLCPLSVTPILLCGLDRSNL